MKKYEIIVRDIKTGEEVFKDTANEMFIDTDEVSLVKGPNKQKDLRIQACHALTSLFNVYLTEFLDSKELEEVEEDSYDYVVGAATDFFDHICNAAKYSITHFLKDRFKDKEFKDKITFKADISTNEGFLTSIENELMLIATKSGISLLADPNNEDNFDEILNLLGQTVFYTVQGVLIQSNNIDDDEEFSKLLGQVDNNSEDIFNNIIEQIADHAKILLKHKVIDERLKKDDAYIDLHELLRQMREDSE